MRSERLGRFYQRFHRLWQLDRLSKGTTRTEHVSAAVTFRISFLFHASTVALLLAVFRG